MHFTQTVRTRQHGASLIACLLALAGTAYADDGREPARAEPVLATEDAAREPKLVPAVESQLSVDSVTASGSGCPAGSWDGEVLNSGGLKLVDVSYRGFHQALGPDAPKTTLDCTLSVKVKHPHPVSLRLTGLSTSIQMATPREQRDVVVARLHETSDWIGGPPESSTTDVEGGPVSRRFSGEGDAWTPCGTEHELHHTTAVQPVDPQPSVGAYTVEGLHFALTERRCPLDEGEPLSAKILKLTTSGAECPPEAFIQTIPNAPGFVELFTFGEFPSDAPFSGHCTLLFDLEVPAGYQFRGAKFLWRSLHTGPTPVKLAATYAFTGAEAQRTEWSLPLGAWSGEERSLHSFDAWSPSCAQPGKPVQLRVDVDMSHGASRQRFAYFSLGSVAFFRNGPASLGSKGSIYPEGPASEWRRCPAR